MQDIEKAILGVFRSNPTREYNTSELARAVFPEKYQGIDNLLISTDKVHLHEGKRIKFQMHRKILYYLNKLIDENILKIASIKDKGEKSFALAVEDGDITIERGLKRITIVKPTLPSNTIEHYEHKKIMKKFEEDSWIIRFNSVLLECSQMSSLEKLNSTLMDCFSSVNDVIALNDFDLMLRSGIDIASLRDFLNSVYKETSDTDKTLSLLINSYSDVKIMLQFIELFCQLAPKRINIVFSMTSKDLQRNPDFFEFIVESFSKSKIKLNIKNHALSIAPYFKGRAGMYTFDDDEWSVYKSNVFGRVIGISCSQSAIAININRFFEMYHTDNEFRQAILTAARLLLSVNTIQRRKSNEYFRNINLLNNPYSTDFYRFSRNYIRFWNYDWHSGLQENNNLYELIKSTKELIDNFCLSEETIFKSCGIPIRFRIAFSSAFRNFDPVFMGERDYKKANVHRAEDFYSGEIKEFLFARERMFKIFDGGDRLRIFRTSDFKPTEIIQEFNIILNSFKIPFFTYDFSSTRGIIKLTNYI